MGGTSLLRRGLVLLAAGLVAACGFQPMYGTGARRADIAAELGNVAVDEIPDRVGFDVRETLVSLLTPRGEPAKPAYRLSVGLTERLEGLLIERDAAITRYNYQLVGAYVLTDAETGKEILKGESRSIAAYNVSDSQFATIIARRDVQERTARDLGHDILNRLALYFETRTPAGAAAP